jgi:hypothetical protein
MNNSLAVDRLRMIAVGELRGPRQWAWAKLVDQFMPMMQGLVPRDFGYEDREDWVSSFKTTFVQAVRRYSKKRSTAKFSTYIFSCLFKKRLYLLDRMYAKKREPKAIACSLNEKASLYRGQRSDEMVELIEFVVDTRGTDAETMAAFVEFVYEVDCLLEPHEMIVWRWLVHLGGDINVVAKFMKMPVVQVAKVYRKIRVVVRENRGSYARLRELLAAFEARPSYGLTEAHF